MQCNVKLAYSKYKIVIFQIKKVHEKYNQTGKHPRLHIIIHGKQKIIFRVNVRWSKIEKSKIADRPSPLFFVFYAPT